MNQSNRNYWLKSGSYSLILGLQNLIFNFGGFYFLIRIIDKSSFGIWTLFIATTSLSDVIRSGLVQNTMIKFLSFDAKKDHPEIITASFLVNSTLSLIFILITASLAAWLSRLWHYPGLVPMFYLYSMVYFLQGILLQFQWLEQAFLSFVGVYLSSLIRQGGFFIYILVCFLFNINIPLINLIYIQIIMLLISTIVEYFFIRKNLAFSFKETGIWIKRLTNYGKFIFGTSIVSMLNYSVKQMMIGTILSPEMAGTFGVSQRIISLAEIPNSALSTILFPQSAKRFATEGKDAIAYLYEKSVGTIQALLFPSLIFLFLFPRFVVHFVAGGRFEDAVPIVQVTILFCLLDPIGRMFGTIMDSIGKPNINFLLTCIFTTVCLTLNFIMIKKMGIMGSVYATIIADLSIYAVMLVILHKSLQINPLNCARYALRFYPEFVRTYIRPIFY